MSRRQFVRSAGAAAIATSLRLSAADRDPRVRWRAALFGHTGEGNYGHELDLALTDRDDVEIVAVADSDSDGRKKAAERVKAAHAYADHRELLAKEKPQLVVIAPRWTHEHHAMAMAALEGGAHLFTEKPFTTTLAEADEILAKADRVGAKIAVAHQMRLAPSIVHLKKEIASGLIGDLIEIRAWGKQDTRAGGEDMMVLGTHLFDLLRLFAGDPLWCSARVLDHGRDITKADARRVKENIGPVAGDEIYAQFAFRNGVNATFISNARLRETAGPWGIELTGSKATVRILTDIFPTIYIAKPGVWKPDGKVDQWQRIENDPSLHASTENRGFGSANRRVVDDWLAAIEEKREPVCSGRGATKSLEMIMAVYHAALSRARIHLPLQDRSHPLL